jgi:hypothetical protein
MTSDAPKRLVVSIDHVAQPPPRSAAYVSAASPWRWKLPGRLRAQVTGFRSTASGSDDLAGEDMANNFNEALREDGHFATISILNGTLLKPWVRLPELVRLRNRCVRASRVLGDFIADCRF